MKSEKVYFKTGVPLNFVDGKNLKVHLFFYTQKRCIPKTGVPLNFCPTTKFKGTPVSKIHVCIKTGELLDFCPPTKFKGTPIFLGVEKQVYL